MDRSCNSPTQAMSIDTAIHLQPGQNPQTGIIIAKIEEILGDNIDALRDGHVLTIPLRNRRTGRLRVIRFPSPRSSEARKFTALLQILHLSHEALVAGTVITKRAIYYQNPELFGSQRFVDELVDDISFTFGFGRDALNIVATGKGLVAGHVSITIDNGSTLWCNPGDSHGVLLPDIRAITGIDVGDVRWLLVVEKEAVFRGLVASRFHETAIVGPGIIVTAKGYPDLSTRQFLHRLHVASPMVPIFGLVDFDPDGVKIMLTYKFGSRSLQHEENTTLNELSWIGPRSGDVLGASDSNLSFTESSQFHFSNQFDNQESPWANSNTCFGLTGRLRPIDVTMPMRAVDRRLAIRLISAAVVKHDQCIENASIIRELQIMLLLNMKAEIQAVDDSGDLTTWLEISLRKRIEGI